MSLCLITGGVRSGKSGFAEELAKRPQAPVLYVATGRAWDLEMAERIQRHQLRRPSDWGLLEIGESLGDISRYTDSYQVVLVDCLSGWVSNRLMREDIPVRDPKTTRQVLAEVERYLQLIAQDTRSHIVVSSEVGLGGVAMNPLGRWFADCLGEANQLVARQADEVYTVLSGIPWRLKG